MYTSKTDPTICSRCGYVNVVKRILNDTGRIVGEKPNIRDILELNKLKRLGLDLCYLGFTDAGVCEHTTLKPPSPREKEIVTSTPVEYFPETGGSKYKSVVIDSEIDRAVLDYQQKVRIESILIPVVLKSEFYIDYFWTTEFMVHKFRVYLRIPNWYKRQQFILSKRKRLNKHNSRVKVVTKSWEFPPSFPIPDEAVRPRFVKNMDLVPSSLIPSFYDILIASFLKPYQQKFQSDSFYDQPRKRIRKGEVRLFKRDVPVYRQSGEAPEVDKITELYSGNVFGNPSFAYRQ